MEKCEFYCTCYCNLCQIRHIHCFRCSMIQAAPKEHAVLFPRVLTAWRTRASQKLRIHLTIYPMLPRPNNDFFWGWVGFQTSLEEMLNENFPIQDLQAALGLPWCQQFFLDAAFSLPLPKTTQNCYWVHCSPAHFCPKNRDSLGGHAVLFMENAVKLPDTQSTKSPHPSNLEATYWPTVTV